MVDNPNLISKNLRKQLEKETLSDPSPETGFQGNIPTPAKVSFHPHLSAPHSPSSSSTPQGTFSTPPSTTHTPLIPFPPLVTAIPVVFAVPPNMANRYAPLQLPANPGAMPQDYQTKISYFDSTGFDSARQHTMKMQD